MVVDLGEDKGSQLALGKRIIFVECLATEGEAGVSIVVTRQGGSMPGARPLFLHLTKSTGNLGPHGVDVIVEGLEGEDLELGLFVGQEAQHSGGSDKARHGGDGAW